MSRLIDLTGKRFGRLLVLGRSTAPSRVSKWTCRCDCGTVKDHLGGHLRLGRSTSCGCFLIERIKETKTKHGFSCYGKPKSKPVYTAWARMKARCTKPAHPDWNNYGGRGIRVCDRWMNFEGFLADMGEPPTPSHSIDRIDNDGNYEPGNCRWATLKQQARNKRNNRMLTLDGQTKCLAEWSEIAGLDTRVVHSRLKRGLDLQQAMTLGKITIQTHSLKQ